MNVCFEVVPELYIDLKTKRILIDIMEMKEKKIFSQAKLFFKIPNIINLLVYIST